MPHISSLEVEGAGDTGDFVTSGNTLSVCCFISGVIPDIRASAQFYCGVPLFSLSREFTRKEQPCAEHTHHLQRDIPCPQSELCEALLQRRHVYCSSRIYSEPFVGISVFCIYFVLYLYFSVWLYLLFWTILASNIDNFVLILWPFEVPQCCALVCFGTFPAFWCHHVLQGPSYKLQPRSSHFSQEAVFKDVKTHCGVPVPHPPASDSLSSVLHPSWSYN